MKYRFIKVHDSDSGKAHLINIRHIAAIAPRMIGGSEIRYSTGSIARVSCVTESVDELERAVDQTM